MLENTRGGQVRQEPVLAKRQKAKCSVDVPETAHYTPLGLASQSAAARNTRRVPPVILTRERREPRSAALFPANRWKENLAISAAYRIEMGGTFSRSHFFALFVAPPLPNLVLQRLVRRHRNSYLRSVRRRYSRICACVPAADHTSKTACSCASLARSIRCRASARRFCLVRRYTCDGTSASCRATTCARARRSSALTTSSRSPVVSASWGDRVRPV